MTALLRPATPDDSGAILGIYAPYVLGSGTTLEITPPAPGAFRERIADILAFYPCVVCEDGGEIVGYAYGARHREREAYRYDVESSVYLKPGASGKGVGGRLYSALLALLAAQGLRNVYAGITLPNDRSLALHRRFGFDEVGTYVKCGYKRGRWLDVVWLVKRIGDWDSEPGEIVPAGGLPERVWREALGGEC